ncbi:MAG: hypothetical protein CMH13_09490 [Martelella sp.]|nr:hypothetical protein [Martelella sp.]
MARQRFGRFHEFGTRLVSDYAWNLDEATFANGVVYKTHDVASAMPQNTRAKVIFVFGPASDAALSVVSCRDRYGEAWIEEHFEHLHSSGRFEDLGHKDVLRFEEQIEGWLNLTGVARAIIHYDALWEYEDELSAFCGIPLKLPQRKSRVGVSKIDLPTQAQFERTYAALDERIASLPRFQILK